MSLRTADRPAPAPPPAEDAEVGPEPTEPGWRPQATASSWAPRLATALAVAGVVAIALWQLHPSLLLSRTTTTGGDTGAHFMLPAYLNDSLLPHLHLTGWDPAWYDGFPLYTYYFVIPDLLAALGSHVVGYDLAFKWATVAGTVTLPVCAWAMGRLFGLRRPIPAALAAATLPFLFEPSFTIYGGNLFSTLAGEYAFSFSLSLALLFLGLMARGLRTGRHRGWAAVVLTLCLLSHILPAAFALAGAAVLTALELLPARLRLRDDGLSPAAGVARAPGREGIQSRGRALWWAASTVGIGLLLSGWWLVPFGLDQALANSMGYTNVTTWLTLFFPTADVWLLVLAGASAVLALVVRSRFGVLAAVLCGCSFLAVRFDPQGNLYNTRFLPFWFISLYLMAGWGVGWGLLHGARLAHRARLAWWAQVARSRPAAAAGRRPRAPRWTPGAVGGPLLAILLAALVVVPPILVDDGTLAATAQPDGSRQALGGLVHVGANQVTNWSADNYAGYEGQSSYPEYQAVTDLMAKVGRTDGCGRAMWEYSPELNRFGTPMALMLLPLWTHGCIDSMEGLLFESSATTPYHFLNQAELSQTPSEPMVSPWLDYGSLNVPLGVEHLQLLGVRYFLAQTPAVEQAAAADPELTLLGKTKPFNWSYSGEHGPTTWEVYEVHQAPVVQALANDPAVLTGVGPGQNSWLPVSAAWYQDPSRWDVELAAGGPSSWPRVSAHGHPAVHPARPTTVSGVHVDQNSGAVRFHVSRTGTPVLVKVSYFPNWHAQGANGPWRVTPNLMVVVPTAHEVVLTYGASGANVLGGICTLAGLVCLAVPAVLAWRRRRRSGAVRAAPPSSPGLPHGSLTT